MPCQNIVWHSGQSFNINIFTSLYLTVQISSYQELCDYSLIHLICKMISVGGLHWGYPLITGIYK